MFGIAFGYGSIHNRYFETMKGLGKRDQLLISTNWRSTIWKLSQQLSIDY
jgi:hypothetical protein